MLIAIFAAIVAISTFDAAASTAITATVVLTTSTTTACGWLLPHESLVLPSSLQWAKMALQHAQADKSLR